jgi:hypothetical protein
VRSLIHVFIIFNKSVVSRSGCMTEDTDITSEVCENYFTLFGVFKVASVGAIKL